MNAPGPARPVLEEFEPRILYAADFAPLVLAGLADVQIDAQAAAGDASVSHEIAFVDLSLPDAQTLIDDLTAQARAGRAIEVVGVQAGEDGLARIGQTLAEREGVTAVHLLGHGSDGVVQLGSARLDGATLLARAGELAGWGRALTAEADLLLYGCDVAALPGGRALIADLAMLTGADVAASDDLTGAARTGGDWVLEQRTGGIEASLAPSAAAQEAVQHTLALLASESFGSSGNLDGSAGGSGWVNAWSGTGNGMQVVGNSLNEQSGLLITSGGSVKAAIGGANTSSLASRDLALPAGTPGTSTWISFLLHPGEVASGDFAGLRFGSTTVGFAGFQGSQFVIGDASGATTAIAGLAARAGQDYLLVLQIDHALGNDTATLYVDPTPGVALPGSAPRATVTNLDFGSFTRLSLVSGNGAQPNRAEFDELRVGQTYADVTPIVPLGTGPSITSNGGGPTAAVAVNENVRAVTTVTSINPDLVNPVSYTITGGADAAKFQIGAATGLLEFIAAPDFETRGDVGTNNVYDVVVRATSLLEFDEQTLAVTVNDIANTLTVTTVADTVDTPGGEVRSVEWLNANPGTDNAISLREAILAANANATAGANEIGFAIAGSGVQTIAVQSALPTLTDTVVIDGSTQPGFAGTPLIEINGAAAGVDENGLVLGTGSSSSEIRGLIINRFTHANIAILAGSANNVVAGNYIGTTATGLAAAGTSLWGIDLISAGTGNRIGGTTAADANVIGGNTGLGGIAINNTTQTVVVGNSIGVGRDGITPVGNAAGIYLLNNTTGTRIGGIASGEANVIAGNQASGIGIDSTTTVSVLGNRIFGNAGMAIDLGWDGAVQANDALDADTGPNGLQNFPVIGSAESNGNELHLVGTLDSRPSSSYRIEFFADLAGEPNNHGEGRTFLGFANVTTLASGRASFDVRLNAIVPAGQVVSATATASNAAFTTFGGTSEFALDRVVVSTNTAPTITAPPSTTPSVAENTTAVLTLTASDAQTAAPGLTWSIAGGADSARFVIGASSGALAFQVAPNFEAPSDAGANNIYNVIVQVSDGSLSSTLALAVTVTNANDAPVAAADAYATPEGTALVVGTAGGVLANDSDADGNPLTVAAYTAPAHGSVSFVPIGTATPFNLTQNVAVDTRAVWSPDGSQVAFDRSNGGNTDIYTMNADGSGVQRLTTSGANDYQAAWSPDGSRIVFTSDRSGNFELWAMNASDGSGLTRLTTSGGSSESRQAAWSPDGSRIAFTSNRSSGNFDIYVMNADGSGATRLASANGVDAEPAWSPDGTQLLFSSVRNGDSEIFRVNADGSGLVQLTSNDALDRAPVWSPDGSRIAFISDRTGSEQVWTMAADGSGPAALTSVAGGASYVDWKPDGSALLFTASGDVQVAALRFNGAFTYTPQAGFAGTDTFTYTTADGAGGTSTATVTITVAARPRITSDATVSVAENGTAVTTVTATDADLPPAQALSYSIAGGADAAKFRIDAASGALTFLAAPDHETPTDNGGNNVYNVVVQVSDGVLTDTQAITVTVTDRNDNSPKITSGGGNAAAALSTPENGLFASFVTASDDDASSFGNLRFSIVGGADAARFGILPNVGLLFLNDLQDFEAPTDSDLNNVYEVIVQVSDGTRTDTQALSISVTDQNEAPRIVSNGGGSTAALTVDDGQTAVTQVLVNDVDAGTTIRYTLGGADAAKFAIDPNGVLTFVSAPDVDAPADAGANNIYNVAVTASDGEFSDTQAIAVTVQRGASAPVITGGSASPRAISIGENQTAVATFAATDADAGTTLSWSIAGGTDAIRFTIDRDTGLLAFRAAPDFEAPADTGVDNVYDVIVQVSDGALTDTQAVAVTVADVNEAPAITRPIAGATIGVREGETAVTTVVATDPDAGARIAYRIAGGADAGLFRIDPTTGALSFAVAPDFEAPRDVGADNVYDVTVEASDGTLAATQALSIGVIDTGDAPVVTANTLVITEGGTATPGLAALDADTPPARLTYTVAGITGGRFEFTAAAGTPITQFTQADVDAGRVRFVHDGGEAAPAYTVVLGDGVLTTAAQAADVTFSRVNDTPVAPRVDLGTLGEDTGRTITRADLLEGASDADRDTLTVANLVVTSGEGTLVDLGNGRWLFTPGADWSGAVAFAYDIGDGTVAVAGEAGLTVLPLNDAPRITSLAGAPAAALGVDENTTAVTAVAGRDVDGPAALQYGVAGGADAALFRIDPDTGALRFASAPDREAPRDADGDNRYEVVVTVSDGLLRAEQLLSVTVRGVDEAPVIVTHTLTLHDAASGGGTSLVLVAADPDTPASALVYQSSGAVGGAFENIAAPGTRIDTFTQADVDAGAIRFVRDGSGAMPTYTLQLSDGATSATGNAPSVITPPPTPTPPVSPEPGTPAPSDVLPVPADVPAPPPAPVFVPVPGGTAATSEPEAEAAAQPPRQQAAADAAAGTPTEAAEAGRSGVSDAGSAVSTARAAVSITAFSAEAPRRDAFEVALPSAPVDAVAQAEASVVSLTTSSTVPDAAVVDLASALRERSLAQALAPLRREAAGEQFEVAQLAAGGTALSASVSVGYVLWLARGGVLMASVLAALPAWASLDPLPVLGQVNGKGRGPLGAAGADEDDEDDADDVERLFSKAPAGPAAQPKAETVR